MVIGIYLRSLLREGVPRVLRGWDRSHHGVGIVGVPNVLRGSGSVVVGEVLGAGEPLERRVGIH